jgi:hypothetical protein
MPTIAGMNGLLGGAFGGGGVKLGRYLFGAENAASSANLQITSVPKPLATPSSTAASVVQLEFGYLQSGIARLTGGRLLLSLTQSGGTYHLFRQTRGAGSNDLYGNYQEIALLETTSVTYTTADGSKTMEIRDTGAAFQFWAMSMNWSYRSAYYE